MSTRLGGELAYVRHWRRRYRSDGWGNGSSLDARRRHGKKKVGPHTSTTEKLRILSTQAHHLTHRFYCQWCIFSCVNLNKGGNKIARLYSEAVYGKSAGVQKRQSYLLQHVQRRKPLFKLCCRPAYLFVIRFRVIRSRLCQ